MDKDGVFYSRDDIYFCTECKGFHDIETNKVVYIPGIEYFEVDGFIYKVRKPRKKKKVKKSKGFGSN